MKTTTMMPVMELRETLRRFGWLVGMLAVISTVTAAAHQPWGRLVEQRQEAGHSRSSSSGLLAQR